MAMPNESDGVCRLMSCVQRYRGHRPQLLLFSRTRRGSALALRSQQRSTACCPQ